MPILIEAYEKIIPDREKFIEATLEKLKQILTENLEKLPEEALPFLEPHLRALYFQAYFLIGYGFYNASLIMQGVLLEALTKEILFKYGVPDEELEQNGFWQSNKRV